MWEGEIVKEVVGKIFKIFDAENGVIIDDLGILYYYDSTEFLDCFSPNIGDIVTFKGIKRVISGHTYYKAMYIALDKNNILQMKK